jgi:hypothetical protein
MSTHFELPTRRPEQQRLHTPRRPLTGGSEEHSSRISSRLEPDGL